MRQVLLIILIGLMGMSPSCRRESPKYLVVSDALHFEVQGGGRSLNLPVFAGAISQDDVIHDVSEAEYYYAKLKSVYDFKSFTFLRSSSSEILLDRAGPLHVPQRVYSYEDSLAAVELSLISFENQIAEYVFRITDPTTGQVRDHHLSVPAGKSASVGTLFDRVRNRGYIITVSVQALTIDRTLTPQALADFLRQKNAPHGDIAAGYYKPSDQRWMDELFGDSAIQLQTSSESAPDTTIRDAVDFDTAPRPKLGFGVLGQAMEYPASAKADSVEGRVLVELRIGTTGAVIASRIIRGVRPDLDSAAIRALRKLEWIPAMKSGSPVEVTVVMPIEYRLQ